MKMSAAVLLLNLLFIIVFIISFRKDKKRYLFLFLFAAVPVLGPALYFIPHFMFRFIHKRDLYSREDIAFAVDMKEYAIKPRMEEEMNVVPFEEAMVFSDTSEKRNLLLGLLKENISDNLSVTLSALNDKDSETSHYAAAATMEIARKYRNSIQAAEEEYRLDMENPAVRRKYADELYDYIESGILSERDRMIQIGKYIGLEGRMMKESKDQVLAKDYVRYTKFFLEMNRIKDALTKTREGLMRFESEDLYFLLMEIYFRTNNPKEFNKTIEKLRNSKVVLSPAGIDRLRFWIARELPGAAGR